ncbi:MAG TPA: anti-sigma factor [Dehalococcoidia bacterium]|nr:anti-sigma factor [Dehalococcoidia bacterium]
MQSHDELEALAAGYALSALDIQERQVFEAHLTTCGGCARQAAELGAVAGVLSLDVEEMAPPPQLKQRILALARAEQAISLHVAPRRWWAIAWRELLLGYRTAAMAAAVLLLVSAGLTVWNFRLQTTLDTSRARLSRSYDAVAIMGQAEHWWRSQGTSFAPDARSSLAHSSKQSAGCLLAWNLPPAAGKVYQVWSIKDGVTTKVGRLLLFDSTLWRIIPGDVSAMEAVQVTLEENDGVAQPKGPVVLQVDLQQR